MDSVTDLTERLREERRDLTDHEQMLDAQSQCVPCKLCGGKAVISDAGLGAGYYIRCHNSLSMRDSKGCMLDERRLGGWAYNVMDWWNRLHAATTLEALTQEVERLRGAGWRDIESAPKDGTKFMVWADGFEWPEVVFWQDYDPEDAEEIGEPGYWRYAEDLLDDATDSCEPDQWTHWMPLPPAPARKALGGDHD